MHIIGRGRYKGEVYPQRQLAGDGALIDTVTVNGVVVPPDTVEQVIWTLNLAPLRATVVTLAGQCFLQAETENPAATTLVTGVGVRLDGAALTPECAETIGMNMTAGAISLTTGEFAPYRRIALSAGAHVLTLVASTNADSTGGVGPGEFYILGTRGDFP